MSIAATDFLAPLVPPTATFGWHRTLPHRPCLPRLPSVSALRLPVTPGMVFCI
jgi:hypothetical protein